MFSILCIIVCFLTACSSGSNSSELIDYKTLDELTAKPMLEMGESENYLPGRLRDLVVTSDGTMLVSDMASVSIEQFGAEGEHVGTVAEEGGGPGELSNYFSMHHLGGDTVIVREQSRQTSYFAKSEEGLFEHVETVSAVQNSDRYLTIFGRATNGNYLAAVGSVIRDIQKVSKNEDDYRLMPTAVIDAKENILADSLHLLKVPAGHITMIDNGFMVHSVPYRYNDRLLMLDDDRYMIARPDSGAFFVYNGDHQLERRITFPVKERPVTSADLDYVLKDVQDRVRNEISNRVHEQKPPYLNAWTSASFIWLQIDETEAGKEMVVVDFEGNPRGKFMLTEFDEVAHVEDNRVYTLYKNPERGESIRVYEVEV